MLRLVIDAGVPFLVFSAMSVVGMELTAEDFRRVARQPGFVVAATIGQLVVLPSVTADDDALSHRKSRIDSSCGFFLESVQQSPLTSRNVASIGTHKFVRKSL